MIKNIGGGIGEGKKDNRANVLRKKRNKFFDQYNNWIDHAKDVNLFLRGVHSIEGTTGTKTGGEKNKLPEDYRPFTEKIYSNLAYTLSRVTEVVQYIRSDEGDVLVQTEGGYALDQSDGEAMAAISEIFPGKTDSEKTAGLLTARLDLLNDRSDIQKSLSEAATVAATQRMAFCVMSWVEDESEIEPLQLETIKIGRYFFDPDAGSIKRAKFIGYEACDLDIGQLEDEYDIELKKDFENKSTLDIEHYYCRDFTSETREMPDENGDMVRDTIYKYPYGWRYTVTIKGTDTILYDGEMQTAGSLPPICIFTMDKLPHSLIGVSVVDKTKDINRGVDRCVQIMEQVAWKMIPKTAIDSGALEDADDLDEGAPADYLKFNGLNGPISNAFGYIPGAPSPEGVYRLADWLIQRGDEMLGVQGLNMSDAIKSDLSGDAIEGIVQSQDGVAGKMRDEWYIFLKEVYSLAIRFYMANEREDVSVRLPTPSGEVSITMNMSKFGFDDKDFETNFDVSVFSPRNMPMNPVKRAEYTFKIMDRVMAMTERNPAAARVYVSNADLPNKAELLTYIDTAEQAVIESRMQAAAAMQGQQVNNAQSEAIYDAALTRANDASKSVGDSLEKLANEAAKAGDLVLAGEITSSIPLKMNQAYQEVMQSVMPQPMQQPEQPENMEQMQ